jgi:peptide/nickel transport system ATP-binding protein
MNGSATRAEPTATAVPALSVQDLVCRLHIPAGVVGVVDGVSFDLSGGRSLGIVGESGSGKSMLARALLGLAPSFAEVSGRVLLGGEDLRAMPAKARRRRLGRGIAMVFQDPMTSLNPVVPIGRQLTEGMRFHLSLSRAQRRARAIELLDQVGIPDAAGRMKTYPHQLSGGMRQRVAIAAALACDPTVLIADEATTALDSTVQQQILNLLSRMRAERDMALILISHDLGVVASRTDDVAVMYAGQIVEYGPTAAIVAEHRHQYTAALLRAVPSFTAAPHTKLSTIAGTPPRLVGIGHTCRFADRCPAREDDCVAGDPPVTTDPRHWHRCLHPVPVTSGVPQ